MTKFHNLCEKIFRWKLLETDALFYKAKVGQEKEELTQLVTNDYVAMCMSGGKIIEAEWVHCSRKRRLSPIRLLQTVFNLRRSQSYLSCRKIFNRYLLY